MALEYDPNKSESNKVKHGIGFEEIQSIWTDPFRLEIPAKTQDEPRNPVIGRCSGKIWTCITTPRNDSIRIISARRARKEEVELYESGRF